MCEELSHYCEVPWPCAITLPNCCRPLTHPLESARSILLIFADILSPAVPFDVITSFPAVYIWSWTSAHRDTRITVIHALSRIVEQMYIVGVGRVRKERRYHVNITVLSLIERVCFF